MSLESFHESSYPAVDGEIAEKTANGVADSVQSPIEGAIGEVLLSECDYPTYCRYFGSETSICDRSCYLPDNQ